MTADNQRKVARRRPLFLGCAALLVATSFVGCHSDQLPTYPVAGTLKFEDGTHPMFGNIEFYNAEHRLNARGKINRDGSFTVGTYEPNDGAVEGTHRVMILQVAGNYLTEKLSDNIKHDHGELVDSAFFDYRTSGLECEIVPGENLVELTVRPNPRQTADGLPEK